jgi:hypothetical protein
MHFWVLWGALFSLLSATLPSLALPLLANPILFPSSSACYTTTHLRILLLFADSAPFLFKISTHFYGFSLYRPRGVTAADATQLTGNSQEVYVTRRALSSTCRGAEELETMG